MSNTSTWDSPDTVQSKMGQTAPGAFYLIDPATGHAAAPGSVSTITNDGSFANESGGNLDAIKSDLDSIKSSSTGSDVTLLASAARTTTQTSSDLVNASGRGVRVTLDMTNAGSGSVTLSINAKDGASGKYPLLLAGAAVATNGTHVYIVYPTLTASANAIAQDVLPHTFQIVVAVNNSNTATYSVGYSILL